MSQTTFSGPIASQNGFIENSFTTAARDAIPNPTVGLLIYNTTTNTYQVYNGTSWQTAFGGGGGSLPVIANSSPTSGPISGYTRVDIYGTNIDNVSSVTFGGTPGIGFISLAPGWVEGFAPPHAAGTVNIQLTTPNGSAISPNTFTYVGPAITAISPNVSGISGGNTATITGTGFTSPATVRFGSNSAANVSVINTTAISATIPTSFVYGTVNVSVTTTDGTATLSNAFTYVGAPFITQVYPNVVSQSGGTTLLVSGSSFVSPLTVNFVDDFAITPLTPTIINSSAFTVVTPARVSAPSAYLNVINSIGSGTSPYLPFVTAPVINTVTPNSGTSAGGTAVTLTGSNFYAPISVSFGSNASTNVTITNSNVAVATAPAGTTNTTVSVSVTSVGGTNTKSSAYSYVYVAPGYTNTQGAAFPNVPIAINPNGSLIAAMGNANVMTYTLSTAWDVTSISFSSGNALPNVSNKTYESSCIAFNGNGTRMYTVARDNTTGQRHIVRYILDTPYNFSSYLPPGTAATANPIAGMMVDVVNQLFFSSDGMYGYIVTNGYLYQYNLSSPYNENDFTTSPAYGVPLNSLGVTPWGMNTPRVATITSDGNYMLFASAGSNYNGQLFRIPMSTPYSVASLMSATTSNTYDYVAISGGYGPSYNGLAIGSADLNVLSTCANGAIAKFVLG